MNSITIKPKLSELNNLNEFILSELPEEDLRVTLIVEEIFVNIVTYSKTEFITVNVEYEKPTLTLEFVDNGCEFNPLLNKDYEIPETIEELKIGGRGIYLTKELSDEIDYNRLNGENHLKIIKKVK